MKYKSEYELRTLNFKISGEFPGGGNVPSPYLIGGWSPALNTTLLTY